MDFYLIKSFVTSNHDCMQRNGSNGIMECGNGQVIRSVVDRIIAKSNDKKSYFLGSTFPHAKVFCMSPCKTKLQKLIPYYSMAFEAQI
jgi:hypothetical protein